MVATSARKGADEPRCAQATDRDVYVGGVEEVAGEPGQAPLCSRGLKKKLPSAGTQGKWILVAMGPKRDSKSFREEGNSGLEVNTGRTSTLLYACHISETNTFTWKGTGICSKNPPSLVSWISITSVTVFCLPACRREKGQWEVQIVGISPLSICFLQMQHWALSVGRIVLGVQQLRRKSCQLFIKPCLPLSL